LYNGGSVLSDDIADLAGWGTDVVVGTVPWPGCAAPALAFIQLAHQAACQGVGGARRNDEGLQKGGIPTFINALVNRTTIEFADATTSLLARTTWWSAPITV
jgi:hypothetical protein